MEIDSYEFNINIMSMLPMIISYVQVTEHIIQYVVQVNLLLQPQ